MIVFYKIGSIKQIVYKIIESDNVNSCLLYPWRRKRYLKIQGPFRSSFYEKHWNSKPHLPEYSSVSENTRPTIWKNYVKAASETKGN